MISPRDFMTLVWPARGNFCLATPFVNKDGREVMAHYARDDIDDLWALAQGICFREKKHVFFAIHTLKELKTLDPRTGKYRTRRVHENMDESKAFFFDLDVGPNEKGKPRKFQSAQDAWNGLDRFLFRTRLPDPFVISSGGGLHVYWIVSTPIPSLEWRKQADKLRHIAEDAKLFFDPSRTVDQSSVLRVPGTRNYKLEGQPRPVRMMREGVVTDTDVFLTMLDTLAADYTPLAPLMRQIANEGNLTMEYGGRVTPVSEVFDVCEHMRNFRDNKGVVSEPDYYAAVGLLMWADDGEHVAHAISAGDPRYDFDETQTKMEQWRDKGPPTCHKINLSAGGDICKNCPNAGKGKNPLDIANKIWAEAPRVEPPMALAKKKDWVKVCDVSLPFQRTNHGVGVVKQDPSNPNVSKVVNFLAYDLFPIEQFAGNAQEPGYSRWVVEIPLEGKRAFTFETNNFSTTQMFTQALLYVGIFVPDANDQTLVRKYMLHYLRDLQRHTQAQAMYDHLGWIYNDDDPQLDTGVPTRFVMCGEAIDVGSDETVSCAMSANTDFLKSFVKKRGTLERQVELLEFYNKDAFYLPHIFMVMCALGAILLRATGEHGVIFALIGEAGSSKSTALYVGASLWGEFKKYVINGTPDGSTVRARDDTVMALANFPVFIDEITLMEPDDARRFVMNATQPTGRDTMTQDRKHRKHRGGVKSTITGVSGNKSVHQMVNTDTSAGQAGTVRVLEADIVKPAAGLPHSKAQADKFLHELSQNFGHIGPAFAAGVVPNLPKVDAKLRQEQARIDARYSIKPEERFYSAAVASALTAGRIAGRMGLHPFDMDALEVWFGTVLLPKMRATIRRETARTEPHEVMGNFLNAINGETLKIEMDNTGNLGGVLIQPHGAISARLDITANEIWIRTDRFAKYCRDNGYNRDRIIDACMDSKLLKGTGRRTLTAGLETKTIRTTCYILDLDHRKAKGIVK